MVSTALASLIMLLADLWRVGEHSLLAPFGLPAVMTVLAGSLLVGVLAACLASRSVLTGLGAAIPLISLAAALREKTWRCAFLRLCDPGAAGRPRPRAPSAAPAAALLPCSTPQQFPPGPDVPRSALPG